MDTVIEVIGLDALRTKLTRLAAHNALAPEMARALEKVRAPLTKAPPPSTFQGHAKWMTPKQRRWFFANLRKGTLQVPYKRSGKLQQSWTARVRSDALGLESTLGPAIHYAHWVQDKPTQAKIHQGRWPTVQDTLERVKPAIVAGFQKEVERLLRM